MKALHAGLARIVEDARERLDAGDERTADGASATGAHRSLAAAIRAARARGELAVIAEVKRRSPSAGVIAADADAAACAARYEHAGAVAVSVLTEPDHFAGSLDDLVAARQGTVRVPLIRKDFLLEAHQLDAARRAGADAALLIAALHDAAQLARLVDHAHAIGIEVLVEVHDEAELERALACGADLLGINSRDLRTMHVDLAVVERLAARIPPEVLFVAESGIRTTADAARVRAAGADAILVGEALMRATDPVDLLHGLRRGSAGT